MKIHELKSKLDYYVDEIYEKGYDLGYSAALEEIEIISDNLWNDGLEEQAETLRAAIATVRKIVDVESL